MDQQFADFFKAIYVQGSLVEFRVWNAHDRGGAIVLAPKNGASYSGWYDRADHLHIDAQRLSGVSGYITINPVCAALKSLSHNSLKRTKTPTGKDDIQFINYALVDIDPTGRPSHHSATSEELSHAIKLRDNLLRNEPEIAQSSLWGMSGNGCFILVRMKDRENSEENITKIKSFLYHLHTKYKTQEASIDWRTYHAASLVSLPKFRKCKGHESTERPWRIVEVHDINIQSQVEITEHNSTKPPLLGEPGGGGIDRRILKYIQKALNDELLIIESTKSNRNQALNKAAYNVGQLVGTGHLSQVDAFNNLFQAALKTGLPEAECSRTIERGLRDGTKHPRVLPELNGKVFTRSTAIPFVEKTIKESLNRSFIDLIQDAEFVSSLADIYATDLPKFELFIEKFRKLDGFSRRLADAVVKQHIKAKKKESRTAAAMESHSREEGTERNPHRLARLYVQETKTTQIDPSFFPTLKDHTFPILKYWNDAFALWEGHYRVQPKPELKSDLSKFLDIEFQSIYNDECRRKGSNPAIPLRMESVTAQLVTDVMLALSSETLVKTTEISAQPAWFCEPALDWDAAEMLQFKNCLVHLPSYANGEKRYSIRPTPLFFSPYAMDYDFNPSPPEPVRWYSFLEDIFPGDDEAKQCIQEWCGYLLLPDTSLQKILVLSGPPRSGKGTIVRVLSSIIGYQNVCHPTISSLGSNFGLQPLLGKSVAFLEEAKISKYDDVSSVVSNILAISGESSRTVDKKNKDPIDIKLPIRFVVVTNDVPDLTDNSGALLSRVVPIHFKNSFVGRENHNLINELLLEKSGILQWAIEGWKRLSDRGYFVPPASSEQLASSMRETFSPIKEFLEDCCRVGPDEKVPSSAAYAAWSRWCEDQGRKFIGDHSQFGRALRSVVPFLVKEKKRIGTSKGKISMYTGISLLDAPVEHNYTYNSKY